MQTVVVLLGILGSLSVIGAAVGVFLMSIKNGKQSQLQKSIDAMGKANGDLREEVEDNARRHADEMLRMETKCALDLSERDQRIARLEGAVDTLKGDLIRDVALEAARHAVREVTGA